MKSKQHLDLLLIEFKELVLCKMIESFSRRGDGDLTYHWRLSVQNFDDLRSRILEESHRARYSINSGSIKMYQDLREVFWLNGLKRDIIEFVAKCTNCQQVKAENQKLGGLVQETQIRTLKWEDVNMDFVVGLPRPRKDYEWIWVVVDRISKSSHFNIVKSTGSVEDYGRMYFNKTVTLHWVPLSIISAFEIISKRFEYSSEVMHHFSSPNGWSSGADYSNA